MRLKVAPISLRNLILENVMLVTTPSYHVRMPVSDASDTSNMILAVENDALVSIMTTLFATFLRLLLLCVALPTIAPMLEIA